MQVLPLTTESVDIALAALTKGGIVAHPTETCYGLACDLTNAAAVACLFALKKRPLNQPVSALFSSIEQVKQYVLWNTKAETIAKKHLPGPLTLILPLRPDAPHNLFPIPLPKLSGVSFQVSGDTNQPFPEAGSCPPGQAVRTGKLEATLGIRISSHPMAQELVTRFGRPISTTSANLHGLPTTYSPEELASQFPGTSPDILLLDAGTIPHCPPSTIIDLTGHSPREVRRGAVVTGSADA